MEVERMILHEGVDHRMIFPKSAKRAVAIIHKALSGQNPIVKLRDGLKIDLDEGDELVLPGSTVLVDEHDQLWRMVDPKYFSGARWLSIEGTF